MKKLYLDDIRIPKTEGWDIVRNYDEFVFWVRLHGIPDEVSFDHDLGEDTEKTGLNVAKWLGQYCIEKNTLFPKWNVHSANPVGKANIEAYINNVIKHQNKL
jgi:hypothetical protein